MLVSRLRPATRSRTAGPSPFQPTARRPMSRRPSSGALVRGGRGPVAARGARAASLAISSSQRGRAGGEQRGRRRGRTVQGAGAATAGLTQPRRRRAHVTRPPRAGSRAARAAPGRARPGVAAGRAAAQDLEARPPARLQHGEVDPRVQVGVAADPRRPPRPGRRSAAGSSTISNVGRARAAARAWPTTLAASQRATAPRAASARRRGGAVATPSSAPAPSPGRSSRLHDGCRGERGSSCNASSRQALAVATCRRPSTRRGRVGSNHSVCRCRLHGEAADEQQLIDRRRR